jgi:hypothetical protein
MDTEIFKIGVLWCFAVWLILNLPMAVMGFFAGLNCIDLGNGRWENVLLIAKFINWLAMRC